jgi:hypothetical protein
MKKAAKSKREDDMLAEYDFSKGERGKYAKRYAAQSTAIVLDADIAPYFPDAAAVNAALRELVKIANRNGKSTAE